ncbi:MAG: hypothetical protein KDK50_05590, partial [Chlamydiia bacterium]|nr:hypothetical protein [Chlamydiia bacterium]
MIRKTLYPLLYFSLLCGQTDGPSSSTNAQSPPCDIGSRACNATARYIQGAGVGYHHSYTTLELFLAPPRCYESWSPYCDLRGHVFNNGKLASNAGIGLR